MIRKPGRTKKSSRDELLAECDQAVYRPSENRKSKKSKEVALLHLTRQKGVARQVGDIPGNRR
jgi:hypothetical protein